MNDHERRAWRLLIALGAKRIELGDKQALDLSPIRISSHRSLQQFTSALVEVVGRSGANRRHVDRAGSPVFVVTDDPEAPDA